MKVKFLGYKRPPTRGKPALTAGKIYETVKTTWNPNYVWLKNDADVVTCYAITSFEIIVEPKVNPSTTDTGVSP